LTFALLSLQYLQSSSQRKTQRFRADKPAFDDPRPAYRFEQHPVDLSIDAFFIVL
jgi:hypothetical protein